MTTNLEQFLVTVSNLVIHLRIFSMAAWSRADDGLANSGSAFISCLILTRFDSEPVPDPDPDPEADPAPEADPGDMATPDEAAAAVAGRCGLLDADSTLIGELTPVTKSEMKGNFAQNHI